VWCHSSDASDSLACLAYRISPPCAAKQGASESVIYPEWGTYPGGAGESPIFEDTDPKNADRERIHGRWAMLATAGAIGQENLGAGPWFDAGAACTPDSCVVNYVDPFGFGPGTGVGPSFALVVGIEALLMFLAEAYRTGLFEPAWPEEFEGGEVLPGGRFDPLNFGQGDRLDTYALAELKHGRLAMFAWAGMLGQAIISDGEEGPVAAWQEHIASGGAHNITEYL
jgi:hypothetical protein